MISYGKFLHLIIHMSALTAELLQKDLRDARPFGTTPESSPGNSERSEETPSPATNVEGRIHIKNEILTFQKISAVSSQRHKVK